MDEWKPLPGGGGGGRGSFFLDMAAPLGVRVERVLPVVGGGVVVVVVDDASLAALVGRGELLPGLAAAAAATQGLTLVLFFSSRALSRHIRYCSLSGYEDQHPMLLVFWSVMSINRVKATSVRYFGLSDNQLSEATRVVL